jgi:hypothetical protein
MADDTLIKTISYHVHNRLKLIVMLFSLYRVSTEGKCHLFACTKNGNKELLSDTELNNWILCDLLQSSSPLESDPLVQKFDQEMTTCQVWIPSFQQQNLYLVLFTRHQEGNHYNLSIRPLRGWLYTSGVCCMHTDTDIVTLNKAEKDWGSCRPTRR